LLPALTTFMQSVIYALSFFEITLTMIRRATLRTYNYIVTIFEYFSAGKAFFSCIISHIGFPFLLKQAF